jgi:hypothetical protein
MTWLTPDTNPADIDTGVEGLRVVAIRARHHRGQVALDFNKSPSANENIRPDGWIYLTDGTRPPIGCNVPGLPTLKLKAKPMSIDWTKPIRVAKDHRPAHVVAITNGDKPGEESYVLINSTYTDGRWWSVPIKRTLDNKPIDGFASGIVFENVPDRISSFVNVYVHDDGRPTVGCDYATMAEAELVRVNRPLLNLIEIVREGDKIVEVKIHG